MGTICKIAVISIFGAIFVSSAMAQTKLPKDAIDCSAFTKQPDGNWYVGPSTTFDFGSAGQMVLSYQVVPPHLFNIGGTDLYMYLESKCGEQPH
jgi:hypothetical protein